jgi:hypothetical protein
LHAMKWDEQNLEHLKDLVRLAVNFIESAMVTKRIVGEISEGAALARPAVKEAK